jgi:hypothetical protein
MRAGTAIIPRSEACGALSRAGLLTALLLALAGSPPRPAWAAAEQPGDHGSPSSRAGTVVDPAVLEATYGIRVQHVALTGGGGLVDLRFVVLDPAKARPLLGGHDSVPRIRVEGDATTLAAPAHGAMRNVRLQKDAGCFVLYPNARNAVKAGTRVAVSFGGVTVSPVVVQ